ncbi:MAG TPA: DUF6603 domain-containing protein [Pseudomonadales bacterium]|nr:DUF6603 domain-containing protein [Pseudomonadales bacterium]
MLFLVDLLIPIKVATSDRHLLAALFHDLGWQVTFNDTQTETFRSVIGVVDEIERIADLIEGVSEDGLSGEVVENIITTSESIIGTIYGLANMPPEKRALLDDLPAPFNDPSTWGDLSLRLPDYLVTTWLEVRYELIFEVLLFVGLIHEEEIDGAEPNEAGEIPKRQRINWDEVPNLLSDPADLIARTYEWGGDFNHVLLVERIIGLLMAIGFLPHFGPVRADIRASWGDAPVEGDPIEIEFPLIDWRAVRGGARFSTDIVLAPDAKDGALSGISLTNFTDGSIEADVDLGDGWSFEAEATGDLDQALSLSLHPSGLAFNTDVTGAEAAAEFTLKGHPDEPWRLIGSRAGPRLELNQLAFQISTDISASEQEFRLRATTMGSEPGLRLVIAPGEGDGFIADILGDREMDITADIGALWSSRDGFKFEGGVGFDVVIPIDKAFGPVLLSSLRLGLDGGTKGLTLEGAITGGLDISVLAVAVEDVGLRAEVMPVPEGEQGLLGPMDLKLGFKPPKGLGLVIDAGGLITGGGYLFHDEELAEYGGVAELGFISVKLSAIGILTTRMPDGADGWALFLSVFSEFPPVQVGFGLTLNGIGGLVGLHRTFDDEALRTRLLEGALDSIMFPENPVANAPRILEDIRAVFPPSRGQFVFGAMLKLAWGTPSIMVLDLGVIIEMPDPVKIALLGQLNLSLPKPDKTIIELNMDVFGVVNVTEGTIAIDATIRDSHILEILTLSGDMAFRATFGDQPTMLMAIGGFHPKFVPPPGVPDLRFMRASLPVGRNASVDLLAYIAVTSNSFQAGGRLEIWVKVAGFSAEGWFGFDALIQFSPFGFDFFVEFGVTVSAGSITLMGVDVATSVVGPGPWVIDGVATFKILKIKKHLELDFEVGQRKTVAVPSYNVEELLIEQLENPENWQVAEMPGIGAMVVLREPDENAPPRVHPGGKVAFRQTIVPFNLKIDKFGAGTVEGRNLFQIESTCTGSGPNTYDEANDLGEWFAPAEFLKMKDAEKIKAPAYEFFDCGVEIGGCESQFGSSATRDVDYEEITIDPALNSRITQSTKRPARLTDKLLAEIMPNRTLVDKPRVDFSLKAAPTAFASARIPGLKK